MEDAVASLIKKKYQALRASLFSLQKLLRLPEFAASFTSSSVISKLLTISWVASSLMMYSSGYVFSSIILTSWKVSTVVLLVNWCYYPHSAAIFKAVSVLFGRTIFKHCFWLVSFQSLN